MVKKLLYQLEQDYWCDFSGVFSPTDEQQFNNAVGANGISFLDDECYTVLTFRSPCTIVVHKGYRWDGCSPKYNILDLFWVGTPDGSIVGSDRPEIPITHERVTHLASVVHDVLGYCKRKPGMPELFSAHGRDLWCSPGRRNRDWLFLQLLERKQHALRCFYYFAVILFGPLHDLMFGQSPSN